MDPKEEFPPVLTPLTCFIFPLCLPGFQLKAKTGAWGGQPIPVTSLTHMGAPKKVQKRCADWSGQQMPQHPLPKLGLPAEPQEYPVLPVRDGLVLVLLVRHLKLVDGALQS